MVNDFRNKFGPLKQLSVEISGEVVYNMDKRMERPANYNGKLRAVK
jgi:hypothetical protein